MDIDNKTPVADALAKPAMNWVVAFTAGSLRKRRTGQAVVSAATSNGARRAGLAYMDLMGHTWARSAVATVRLATAQDLGCVHTGGETGGAQ